MKTKNIFICMILIVTLMLNVITESDCKNYVELKSKSCNAVKKEDLPFEFSDNALKTINEFIQKTHDLDYEIVVYFDYITGKILKCASGKLNNVIIDVNENDFEGMHVASIHNHPKELLSPPSDKNFKIFERKWEDYELIVGFEHFWILKAKGLWENLVEEARRVSQAARLSSLLHCTGRYADGEVFNRMQDVRYGEELLNYICNKNIDDIQLTKKEYASMGNDLKTVKYECSRRITNPEVIEILREFELNPYTPSAKDIMYNMYKSLGMDIGYDEIFAD